MLFSFQYLSLSVVTVCRSRKDPLHEASSHRLLHIGKFWNGVFQTAPVITATRAAPGLAVLILAFLPGSPDLSRSAGGGSPVGGIPRPPVGHPTGRVRIDVPPLRPGLIGVVARIQ